MTPSLRGRIQSTLNRYHAWVISLDEATERILLAVKEELPEKHDYDKCPYCAWPESCVDWNDAIEEMERRLGLGTESTNKKP